MYCSGCGLLMEEHSSYCPRCGKQAGAGASVAPPVTGTRVERHVRTLGILWVLYAVWALGSWLLVAPFLAAIFHHWGLPWRGGFGGLAGPSFLLPHLPWLMAIVTPLLLARFLLSVVTGIALLSRAPWARTLALITAFLTLIRPITGTILAIYTLWVLLPGASGQEYNRIAAR